MAFPCTDKQILILVTLDNVHANGSVQQPYFFKQVLDKLGYNAAYAAGSIPVGTQFLGEEVTPLESVSWKHVAMVLMVCHIVEDDSNTSTLKAMKSANVKLVQVLCGNHYFFNLEDIVFNRNKVVYLTYNTFVDEVWQFPMHSFSNSFMSALLDAPVQNIPYVWDPDIIDMESMKKGGVHMQAKSKDNEEVFLVCMEPNLNVTKTCVTPMLMADLFYKKYPKRLAKLLVFSADALKARAPFQAFCKYLQICKDAKVEYYPRVQFPEVLLQLKGKNVVFLSHQLFNNQNYINLEILHYGYSLVHNSETLLPCGFYYADDTIHLTADTILQAATTSQSMVAVEALKKVVSCSNISTLTAYNRHLCGLLQEVPPAKEQAPGAQDVQPKSNIAKDVHPTSDIGKGVQPKSNIAKDVFPHLTQLLADCKGSGGKVLFIGARHDEIRRLVCSSHCTVHVLPEDTWTEDPHAWPNVFVLPEAPKPKEKADCTFAIIDTYRVLGKLQHSLEVACRAGATLIFIRAETDDFYNGEANCDQRFTVAQHASMLGLDVKSTSLGIWPGIHQFLKNSSWKLEKEFATGSQLLRKT